MTFKNIRDIFQEHIFRIIWFGLLIMNLYETNIWTTTLLFYFGWNKLMTDAKIKNIKTTILEIQKRGLK